MGSDRAKCPGRALGSIDCNSVAYHSLHVPTRMHLIGFLVNPLQGLLSSAVASPLVVFFFFLPASCFALAPKWGMTGVVCFDLSKRARSGINNHTINHRHCPISNSQGSFCRYAKRRREDTRTCTAEQTDMGEAACRRKQN